VGRIGRAACLILSGTDYYRSDAPRLGRCQSLGVCRRNVPLVDSATNHGIIQGARTDGPTTRPAGRAVIDCFAILLLERLNIRARKPRRLDWPFPPLELRMRETRRHLGLVVMAAIVACGGDSTTAANPAYLFRSPAGQYAN
jgi:hypothetical protein